VCTCRKLALPHWYVWGQSCFQLQHIVPHSLHPANAAMWRHTRALPIESKQATHRHSQFLPKKIHSTYNHSELWFLDERAKRAFILAAICLFYKYKRTFVHNIHKTQKSKEIVAQVLL
jgi:hypothetical protein